MQEDDYPSNCTQSPTCAPASSITFVPNSGGLAYDETGEIFYLTIENGYVSTGACVHLSPCYNGTNGPALPEAEDNR